MMRPNRWEAGLLALGALFASAAPPVRAAMPAPFADRLALAEATIREIAANRQVPGDVARRARAVAIFPGTVKAGLVLGIRLGRGVVMAKDGGGRWKGPGYYTITGGSWGIQAGLETTDIVLFFLSDTSVEALKGGRFTLGKDLVVVEGPKAGRGGADWAGADVVSYARTSGLFVGFSVPGSVFEPYDRMNDAAYGRPTSAADIVEGRLPVPPEAEGLVGALEFLSRTP